MSCNITNCILKTYTESVIWLFLVQISAPVSDTFVIYIF